MSARSLHRTRHARTKYPYDAEHPSRPYGEVQHDIGSILFFGAIVLVALMALIVYGLM